MRRNYGLVIGSTLMLSGCSHAPAFDIFGSFFPVWLFCIVAGIVLALLSRIVMLRFGTDTDYGPPLLVYPSLIVLFSCAIWLLFFR